MSKNSLGASEKKTMSGMSRIARTSAHTSRCCLPLVYTKNFCEGEGEVGREEVTAITTRREEIRERRTSLRSIPALSILTPLSLINTTTIERVIPICKTRVCNSIRTCLEIEIGSIIHTIVVLCDIIDMIPLYLISVFIGYSPLMCE